MDRKRSDAALTVRLCAPFLSSQRLFPTSYITGYTVWYHRAIPNLSLMRNVEKSQIAVVILDNICSSFSVSQNCNLMKRI